MDKSTNTMGYELITFCKTCQLMIANGRIGKDAGVGKLTCKDASVVDYVLLSYSLLKQVATFEILNFNEFYSDIHCAVLVQFTYQNNHDNSVSEMSNVNCPITPNTDANTRDKTVKWDNAKEEQFFKNLNVDSIKDIEFNLDKFIADSGNVTKENINDVIKEVNSLLLTTASGLDMLQTKRTYKSSRTSTNKAWFNKVCKLKRKEFNKARRKHLKIIVMKL